MNWEIGPRGSIYNDNETLHQVSVATKSDHNVRNNNKV